MPSRIVTVTSAGGVTTAPLSVMWKFQDRPSIAERRLVRLGASENRRNVMSEEADSNLEFLNRPRYVELVCPTCHIVTGKMPEGDRIAQRAFDDTHRQCYVSAVPYRQV
jgi:hypothetical protein